MGPPVHLHLNAKYRGSPLLEMVKNLSESLSQGHRVRAREQSKCSRFLGNSTVTLFLIELLQLKSQGHFYVDYSTVPYTGYKWLFESKCRTFHGYTLDFFLSNFLFPSHTTLAFTTDETTLKEFTMPSLSPSSHHHSEAYPTKMSRRQRRWKATCHSCSSKTPTWGTKWTLLPARGCREHALISVSKVFSAPNSTDTTEALA